MAKHTPIAEQQRLVAEWRRTQHSVSAFARNVGIHPNTFWSWTKKYRPDELEAAPAFVDVTPQPASAAAITVRVGAPGRPPYEFDFSVWPPPTWFAAMARKLVTC